MGEVCCLRLMQADGMNDNLSGNPAMPPPPQARLFRTERESQAGTPMPTSQQEWKSQAATRLPASNNNRYRQTAVKAALAIFLFI
ncbi:MAG: hypothetical protein SPJ79_05160 [Prevotella sp.]|nr:hypothetical protein [Prevotella sp.]